MSYDLFAFDTSAVPTDEELRDWYHEQTEWSEERDYSDPAGTAPALHALYRELIQTFPPIDGPDAAKELPEDVESHADYCIGSKILSVSFFWSDAEKAQEAFVRLGLKHGAGVCEVSEVPVLIHRPAISARHTHTLLVQTDRRPKTFWLGHDPSAAHRLLAAEIGSLGAVSEHGKRALNIIVSPLVPGREYEEHGTTKEFFQTAGTAQRLTAEIKRREPDGSHRQYVLGRPGAAGETDASEPIPYGEQQQIVRPSEVLTAAEVIPLFRHYYEHTTIPDGWHLRELPQFADLGK